MRYFPWLKGRLLLLHLLLLVVMASCQNTPSIEPGLSPEQLEATYTAYREASLTHRRFKHQEIVPLIQKRGQEFSVEVIGQSIQGRDIYQLDFGGGPIKVLLWSQIHGN